MLMCIRSKSKKERGASLIEYVLLIALIAIVAIAAIRLMGVQAAAKFDETSLAISGQSIGPGCGTGGCL
jgi:Flp pilus assembly pilin Flp